MLEDNDKLEQIQTIVKNVAPFVYLNSKDQFHPSSFPWYLERVQFQGSGAAMGPPVCASSLPEGDDGRDTNLQYPTFPDPAIEAGDLSTAQMYVHVVGKPGSYHIQYWFFYPFNGPGFGELVFRVAGVEIASHSLSLAPGGEHQGDWEHITVVTDEQGTIQSVYCAQHTSGAWYSVSSEPNSKTGPVHVVLQDGHPVIYSSLNGHPSFPAARTFPTGTEIKFGPIRPADIEIDLRLANFNDQGPLWDGPNQHKIVAIDGVEGIDFTQPRWLQYYGRAGAEILSEERISELQERLVGLLENTIAQYLSNAEIQAISEAIAREIIEKLPEKVDFKGPVMPKAKSSWEAPDVAPGAVRRLDNHCGPGLFVYNNQVYFQGSPARDKLYHKSIFSNSSHNAPRLDNHCGYGLFVYEDNVYFQGGPHLNVLYRKSITSNSGERAAPLDEFCGGGLFVYEDYVYFQGGPDFNGLYRKPITSNIGESATPVDKFCGIGLFVYDGYVYFQGGPDFNGLFRKPITSTSEEPATPVDKFCGIGLFVYEGYVYFQGGPDFNGLFRKPITSTSEEPATPVDDFCGVGLFVYDDYVYFQGGPSFDALYRKPITSTSKDPATKLDNNCGFRIVVYNNVVYFQGDPQLDALYQYGLP